MMTLSSFGATPYPSIFRMADRVAASCIQAHKQTRKSNWLQWILTGGKEAILGLGREVPLDRVLCSHCKMVVNSNTDFG